MDTFITLPFLIRLHLCFRFPCSALQLYGTKVFCVNIKWFHFGLVGVLIFGMASKGTYALDVRYLFVLPVSADLGKKRNLSEKSCQPDAPGRRSRRPAR